MLDKTIHKVYIDNQVNKSYRKEGKMDKLQIAQKLKALRGDKSQKKVADDLGITSMAISLYESGERIPRDEMKERLAAYYKISVQELFYT